MALSITLAIIEICIKKNKLRIEFLDLKSNSSSYKIGYIGERYKKQINLRDKD